MGRKRLDESEKKVAVKLTIKKKYLDELKERKVNISELLEKSVIDYLKK